MSASKGKLNFSRNIFLELEELTRFQDFLQNDSKQFLFQNNAYDYGIVPQSVNSGNDFLVAAGTSSGTFKIAYDSCAIDSDLNVIALTAFDDYPVTDNSLWYWVKVTHRYLNTEVGTVSINTSGELNGTSTLFLDILRAQTSKTPVKIVFYKESVAGVPIIPTNSDVYEVVSVTNNTYAILSGSFTAESGLSYIVVGSNALGTSLTAGQKEGIYSYDNCTVSLVIETVSDTPPTSGYTANKDFYVARVKNTGGTLTIQDKRTQYWTLNSDFNLNKHSITSFSGLITYTIDDEDRLISLVGSYLGITVHITLPAPSKSNYGKLYIVDYELTPTNNSVNYLYIKNPDTSNLVAIDWTGTETKYGTIAFYNDKTTWYYFFISDIATPTDAITGTETRKVVTPYTLSEYTGGNKYKTVEIGDWNMDTTTSLSIPITSFGLEDSDTGLGRIRGVQCRIRDDAAQSNRDICYINGSFTLDGSVSAEDEGIGGINILLSRRTGGVFDSASFDATSYNRGWVTVWYN